MAVATSSTTSSSSYDNSWMPFPTDADADPRSLAPLVITPRFRVLEMVSMGRIVSSDKVVDLGSGDGSLLLAIAETSGATCIGVELEPELVASSRALVEEKGMSEKVSIEQVDIMAYEKLVDANVVILFLTPWSVALLGPKLIEAVEKGVRILSYMWELQDMPKKYRSKTGVCNNLYLYEMNEAS